MNSVKPWLIKVLNGPNAGAQILVSKEITVGTSIDCDLILNDPHISAIHCQIQRKEEDSFEITPRDGLIFINGTKVEQGIGILKLGDVLTLGSTHLTGGPSEQLWPPVTIPTIQEVGGTRVERPPASEADPAAVNQPSELSKKKKILSTMSLVILIVVGVCVFMGLALFKLVAHKNLNISRASFQPSSFDKEDRMMQETERSDAEAAGKEIQKKFPNNSIKIVQRNGEYALYIYVRNQVQRDAVRKVMNEMAMPVVSNIVNIDNIDDSALAMMQAMNLAVAVSVDEHTGKAIWTGYLPNEELLDSLKKQIARDIPAITDQEFHIILGENAAKMIHEALSKNYFGAIVITPERKNLVLTGTVSIADSMRWETVLKELENQFLNKIKLVNMVTITTTGIQNRGLFNSPVVSVSISSSPYAVLQDGERIFLGAKLNDGYIVNSITTKGIGVTNNNGAKVVPVAGE